MSGWLRYLWAALAILVLLALLGGGGTWWAIHTVPAEYERVRVVPVEQAAAAGDELERHATTLTNRARETGQWQAVFTQDQMNGWLAVDLPEKFSDALPPQFGEPRVTLAPDRVRLFARYSDGAAETVLSLEVSIQLTGQPNEIAVRLRGAYAGALPVPLGQIVEQITDEARANDLRLRWTQEEGDPVALVSLPPEELTEGRIVLLEKLEVREGEIFLSGLTSRARRDEPDR